MGTLYNCLREVRLEKYYPAFRANGITCYESLANLTMAELCAMGISGSEDRRRLVELVNIIKSVNRSENSSSGGAVPRKRQTGSPTPSSARSALSAPGGAGFSGSQSEKKVARRRPRSPPEGAVGSGHGMRLEPTRDVSVRERGPNFSVGSYLDMLEFMSDGSHSDAGDHQADSSDGEAAPPHGRPQPPPPAVSSRNPPRKLASADRVRSQARSKGYNYGVPSNRDSAKSRGKGGGGVKVTKDDRIRVCVRKRPLSRRESRAADPDIIEAQSTTTVVIKEPKVAVDLTAFTMKHEFVFDEVFDEGCSNEDVYIRAARPLITTVFQRSNATFFAYGQTGAGKTHTMIGSNGVPGLYQLAAQDVFDIMASGQYGADLHVWVSFFEIYCGQLFDLLNRRSRLVAREDGSQRVCIAGLTETEVPDVQTLIRVLQFGNSVRSRGTSGVNPDSSRSHAVLQMEVRHADDAILGKISFIDLAGSERASDMGDPDRQTRMEGAEINQSLLALKECIRSIDQESRHTPFRQSKLTHILKDAFVGNSRTCMIANVSPVQSACEHTLNTLRYADRVKELRRDSSQSAGGASFGQAMNLLMNIPITAPTIFHPSNVLSTSTPVRPRLHDHPHAAAADVTFDPSETPIRGHNVFPKSASKIRSKPPSESLSVPSKARQSTGSRLPSGAAASQGVLPPHPEASPSESDHTDTDSNNVTHPTETRLVPSVPNIPVIRSTDTEFDFPTSDFNIVDEQLNDLSHGGNKLSQDGVKAGRSEVPEGKEQSKEDQGQLTGEQAASASSARSDSQKPQSSERRVSNPSPTNQLSGRGKTQGHRQSPSPASKPNKTSPPTSGRASAPLTASSSTVAHKTAMSELGNVSPVSSRNRPGMGPSTDSFDDELLFGGPRDERSPGQEAKASSVAGGPAGERASKPVMKVLPGLQTALSSDLTSFSQRSPLRSGVLEKVASNPSPREHQETEGAPPCNVSPSPRHEGPVSTRGDAREPSPGKGNNLPSPSCAAIRDWVTHKGDVEPGSARSNKQRAEKQAERSDTTSVQASLPFSAYSVADPSPHHASSTQERLQGRVGSQGTGDLGDASSAVKALTSSHGLSGPSSDPIVPSLATASTFGAKDANVSSASLPAQSNTAGTKFDAALESHVRNDSSDNSTATTVFTSTKTSSSSALVTEKLMSGAVFSPIHPQPVSTTGGLQPTLRGRAVSSSSSSILHPTPVSAAPSVFASSAVMSAASFNVAERDQARISMVGYHEDQLATITSLCKQEMKLLLNAKKAVPRSFDDYLSRVSSILSLKMSAIQQLQDHIHHYQARFSQQPLSAPASASGASSNDGPTLPPT